MNAAMLIGAVLVWLSGAAAVQEPAEMAARRQSTAARRARTGAEGLAELVWREMLLPACALGTPGKAATGACYAGRLPSHALWGRARTDTLGGVPLSARGHATRAGLPWRRGQAVICSAALASAWTLATAIRPSRTKTPGLALAPAADAGALSQQRGPCQCSLCAFSSWLPGKGRGERHNAEHAPLETKRNGQDRRAVHFGAGRYGLWASSPLSYLTTPTAHPVEPRARKGSCRSAQRPRPLACCHGTNGSRLLAWAALSSGLARKRSLVAMVRFVGLDVHTSAIEACVLDPSGQVLLRCRFPTSREEILAFANKHLGAEDEVCLEATTNTWAVARLLRPKVARVAISNPLTTKAIAQSRVKTDKVDAEVLAQLLRTGFLPEVWQPDEVTQRYRTLCSRRASLVADRTGVKNRIHAVLHQSLIQCPYSRLFSKKGLAWLQQEAPLDELGRELVESDLRVLDAIEAEIERLDKQLAQSAWQEDSVRLLMTIPGIDYTVAMGIMAAIGDHRRFNDPDKMASYFGLVSRTKQSGDKSYHGPITKQGSSHGRWLLIQAAQHLGRHPGPLGAFFRRLKKRKNHNVAVTATARKMVVIIWHMLKNNEPYRYAQPRSTQDKLAKLRVKVTGRRRRSSPTKGKPRKARLGPGTPSRTIKSLAQVYMEEGLPPRAPLSEGEKRAVRSSGTSRYVASLEQQHVVPRKGRKKE